ncbi:nucleotidyltransferase family protein [uncultured Tateyamaria sp.]|uniref:nucleotidyltransferase family protein n=1 Tax=Tateyamaria sp. 1078 TaxID=3417464 RepID=UPI002625F37B|nr:nucleotidyltransferase family protein [uncultured Tateyamaria sp.]
MMPVLILAAGASFRMRGQDKLLMDIDGVPLLARQVRRALSVSEDVRVALPAAPHPRYACVAPPARAIDVPDADEGMAASLRRLIATLGPDTPTAMILLADLPDITVSDLKAVMGAVQTHPNARIWRGATQDGKPGHPLIIRADLFSDFATLTGDTGGQHILAQCKADTCLVPLAGQRARLDLDTPEDWAAWRASTAGD